MNRFNLFVLLLAVAWAGVLPADAQPVTTIYSFGEGPANPQAGLTLGPDGNYYGTTEYGGLYNEGTLFKVTTNGILTTLVNFNRYDNGAWPVANLLLAPDGNFYGTTIVGGAATLGNINTSWANAAGTVFRVTTNGTVTVLVNFNGVNGGEPRAGLALGPDGNFYGTTDLGGLNGDGTVFKLSTNGTLTTLVSFNGTNGANPLASLMAGPGGSLYGTTAAGGTNGNFGTVFAVTTNGTFTTVFQFGGTNGYGAAGGVTVGPDGNLYGTTGWGANLNDYSGLGGFFELTTNGLLTSLVSVWDLGGLTVGPDGNFYGISVYGGANGNGSVFQVTTNGTLAMLARLPGIQFQTFLNVQGFELVHYTTNNWTNSAYAEVFGGTYTNLYSFSALTSSFNADGAHPQAGLTLGPDGCFYGTASGGGTSGYGTAFKVTTNGTFATLASFSGNTGDNPQAALTPGPNGSLYGTANRGGTSGYGTVFKLTFGGALTTLVNFDRANDGANPQAGLIPGPGGNFYGTAVGGGTNLLFASTNNYDAVSDGTVFALTTNGGFSVLAYFNGTNGANPNGGLAVGTDGNLYGTTTGGGISNAGTIFRVLTNGTLTTLTHFTGANGANPYASLTVGPGGNFYGTCQYGGPDNDGAVFQVTTNGTLTPLVWFNGANGAIPTASLLLGPDGNFYGTTGFGGSDDYGTVFKVTTGGALTTLVNFDGINGGYTEAGLALGPDGNFYGTSGGGVHIAGSVFELTTNGTLTTLYSFEYGSPDGYYPFAGLTLATNGNFVHFYGTTCGGGSGSGGGGTVFQLDLTTAYAMAENSTNTFYPMTNEVLWAIGGVLGLVSAETTNGAAQVVGSSIGFTPTANFTGTATINYVVTDNAGGTNHSVILLLVTNVPPVANPAFYAVAENTTNPFSPLVNDVVGTTGGTLSLVSLSPTNGTAVISGTNVLFTPATNFTGTATIGYTITDNVGGTNRSLITVLVTNVPPVANPAFYAVAENTTNPFSPLVNDLMRTTGGTLSLVSLSPTNGTAVINGTNVLFTPFLNFLGTATIGYTITDHVGGTNSSLITITVTNSTALAIASPTAGQVVSNAAFTVTGTASSRAAVTNVCVQLNRGGWTGATSANGWTNWTANVSLTAGSNTVSAYAVDACGNPSPTNSVLFDDVTNTLPLADLSLSLINLHTNDIYSNTNLVSYEANGQAIFTFSIVVSNAGPAVASGVVVSNQIPTGLTFNRVTGGASPANGLLLAPLGTLAVGATNVIELTLNVFSNGDYTSVFQVLADQADPDPTNNSATVVSLAYSTTTETESTRSLDFYLDAPPVGRRVNEYSAELIATLPNGTVVYDQTFPAAYSNATVQAAVAQAAAALTNAGAAAYAGPAETNASQTLVNSNSFTTTNTIGTGVTFSSTVYIGPTNIMVGDNQSQSFYVAFGNEDVDTLMTTDVTNLVTTTNTDTYLNSAQYVLTGTLGQADLSLTVTVAPNPVNLDVSNLLTFTLTVSNAGPATATDVTVSNQVFTPGSGLSFDSATGGGAPTNGLLLLNPGSLAPGATNVAQITARVNRAGSAPTRSFTNLFQVLADQADPEPANALATVTFAVTNANATLATTSTRTWETNLTAGVNQPTTNYSTDVIAVSPDGTVVYNQTMAAPFSAGAVQAAVAQAAAALANAGAPGYTGPVETSSQQVFQGSSSVTLTNLAGTNITVVTNTQAGPQTIFVGTGQTNALILYVGETDYDTLTTLDVTNLVTTTTTSNYLSSAVYTLTGLAAPVDLALSLTAAPDPVAVGAPLTYSLTVTNNSPTTATGVVVSNTLPPNVTLFSLLPSQGSATNQAGLVIYTVGGLANGRAATLAMVVVPGAAGLLTNTAGVFSLQTNWSPANTRVTNVTPAVAQPITNLVLTVLSPVTLNPQTGLFEQRIQVANGGPATPSSVLVLVSGLAAPAMLYNATGATNGTPFVQSASPLGVGSNVVFLLEYYVPTRVAPTNLTLTVQAGPVVIPPAASGAILSVSRTLVLANGNVLVEFDAVPGQVYAIQYSSDLVTWLTAVPAITAPANRVQWIDAGPPQTVSNPAQQPARYYRVVRLTAP